MRASRPIHLRVGFVALVFVGGAFGTAARFVLSEAWPPIDAIPYAVFAVNIVGALLLGVLLEATSQSRQSQRASNIVRALLGVGVLGGFTTYSALAVDTVLIFGSRSAFAAVLYGLGTVVIGAIATWCGIALAHAARRRGHQQHSDTELSSEQPGSAQPGDERPRNERPA